MMNTVMINAAGVVLMELTVLTVLVAMFDKFAPKHFIRERHDFALAVFLIAPVLFALSVMPDSNSVIAAAPIISDFREVTAGIVPVVPDINAIIAPAPTIANSQLPLAETLLALWLAGAILMLTRLAFDVASLIALRARSELAVAPHHIRLSAPAELRRSRETATPLLAGYFRPAIILPDDFTFNNLARPVLEHEIAHQQRRDQWTALFLRVITAIFWWAAPLYVLHPIVSRNRETLCDSRAAAITKAPRQLAHALLNAASRTTGAPALALAAKPQRSTLAARINHLTSANAAIQRDTIIRLPIILPILAAIVILITPQMGDARDHRSNSRDGAMDQDGSSAASNGSMALYRAAHGGRMNEVRKLIREGADPSAYVPGEGTPLIAAVRGKHVDVLNELLELGANPNLAAPGDGTALISATSLGRTDMVSLLVEAGADPNLGIDGDGNPMIAAARRGNTGIVSILLDAGGNPNSSVERDGNPLIGAAHGGHPGVAQQLLDAGADPNGYVFYDETPLINAVQKGHISVAEVLVNAGADVSLTVKTGRRDPGGPYRSPLSEAERIGRTQMIRWLKDRGAEHLPPTE